MLTRGSRPHEVAAPAAHPGEPREERRLHDPGFAPGVAAFAGGVVGGLDDLVRPAGFEVLERADRPRGPADGQPRHLVGRARRRSGAGGRSTTRRL